MDPTLMCIHYVPSFFATYYPLNEHTFEYKCLIGLILHMNVNSFTIKAFKLKQTLIYLFIESLFEYKLENLKLSVLVNVCLIQFLLYVYLRRCTITGLMIFRFTVFVKVFFAKKEEVH